MRLRGRGFLLLSFAFSSVLTFTQALEIQARDKNEKAILKTPSNSTRLQISEGKIGNLTPTEVGHEMGKRSAEIFSPTENKNGQIFESEKRARLGFAGMRGKKEYSADDSYSGNVRARLDGALNKRFFRSFNELFGGKRATMAFHGMRGKKSQDYDNEILNPETYDSAPHQEFLINSGLIDDPGETGEFGGEKRPEEEIVDEDGLSKRSPYSFQGMRGKKENAYNLKRAMGFLGMRGKKTTEIWDGDANYKRAPQMSFFGMKGKKAQSSGFFGMRGKKASSDSFIGIKGKREPVGYEFQDVSLLNQMNESGPSRTRFRREIIWLNNSKKAKNAFFGIRGKKSTEERPKSRFSTTF